MKKRCVEDFGLFSDSLWKSESWGKWELYTFHVSLVISSKTFRQQTGTGLCIALFPTAPTRTAAPSLRRPLLLFQLSDRARKLSSAPSLLYELSSSI